LTTPDPSLAVEEHHVELARRFIGARCQLGATLVVPMGVLWREFKGWTPNASAEGLRAALELAPWAAVVERPRARGRFRTVVMGIGFRATV
jgi:hypothetical protein